MYAQQGQGAVEREVRATPVKNGGTANGSSLPPERGENAATVVPASRFWTARGAAESAKTQFSQAAEPRERGAAQRDWPNPVRPSGSGAAQAEGSQAPAAEGAAVRVLVVDDQQLMRDGIASLLSIQEGIEVIGAAANGQEAIEQALALNPDVILMDVRMPVLDGVAATAAIRRQLPDCQVLMLTTFDDDAYVLDAMRAGAVGYLLKDIPARDLAQAIQAAHRRIYQLDPAVASRLVATLVEQTRQESRPSAPITPATGAPGSAAKLPDLSEREVEVLRLIAQGATNREIAEHLVISEGTVKNHISHILGRLGLRDRTQAAIYAREHGLL